MTLDDWLALRRQQLEDFADNAAEAQCSRIDPLPWEMTREQWDSMFSEASNESK